MGMWPYKTRVLLQDQMTFLVKSRLQNITVKHVQCTHIYIGEWQDLQKLSKSCENDPGLNPNTESISQVQTTSSKVCVRVKAGIGDILNIYGECIIQAV
ncbi:Hypothetical predicted protein [Mytilus galloprovincialis]|uniref:Uncharacterized protein n=1 Tax=Mytilus galloprovincialis TaxID=29158 RepID=A0A8B6HL93_MYTGA|nr:Hypothetical predicted protein [Mytilus galloprovincialis]